MFLCLPLSDSLPSCDGVIVPIPHPEMGVCHLPEEHNIYIQNYSIKK